MKKLLYLICLLIIASCSKDESATKQTSNTYAVWQISRSYVSLDQGTYTDSILSTSYWSKNGIKKYLPIISIISDPGTTTTQGYDYFRDSVIVKKGDLIELCLNIKHASGYWLQNHSAYSSGGIWIWLRISSQEGLHQFMCTDSTLTETVSYTVQ